MTEQLTSFYILAEERGDVERLAQQHPLTDEMIDKMSFIDVWWSDEYGPNNEDFEEYRLKKSMRSAYDKGGKDMLEQVIEWLRSVSSREYVLYWDGDAELNKDELIADLKKAMRPQESK